MKILITGASSNVGRGMIPRLKAAGHDLVLSDIIKLPDAEPFAGLPFVQCDVQAGFGLERASHGCDLILHLPAWHGIHWGQKTEIDFWRLNVDGTFWMFQAAQGAGIKRVVFLSSQAWHGHYDKYGFTKRVGEELCEYNRRNHGIRYVAIRPADFTPWGNDFVNHYGARLLYGGVDREDVLDCVTLAVQKLASELPQGTEAEGIIANAVRPNAFTAEQIEGWADDPLAACEKVFPGSRPLVEKYGIRIQHKPGLSDLGEGAAAIGYAPQRHFGTFLDALRRLDTEGGAAAAHALHCPY
ncbi:MAG: NAD(P)-dependent oxidoreductase [Abitibacteriaceae bacterium]|nr:NAD(P)-dependent oxidoreductase [Abditibacteriaceae bacterium]